MAKTEKMIPLPHFPGIKLTHVALHSGYDFGKPEKDGSVDVVRKSTGEKGANLKCVCMSGSGGCTLSVAGGIATCMGSAGGCKNCGFVVTVPQGAFAGHLGDVFRS